jgi:hypothetical protein
MVLSFLMHSIKNGRGDLSTQEQFLPAALRYLLSLQTGSGL